MLEAIALVVSIVLGLGAVGIWLITAGRNMERNKKTAENVDGIGRKVENVRIELSTRIDKVEADHQLLAREVSELKAIAIETNKSVNQLVQMHMRGTQ